MGKVGGRRGGGGSDLDGEQHFLRANAVLRNRNEAGGGRKEAVQKMTSPSVCLPYLVLWILMETSRLDSLECHPTLDCFLDRGKEPNRRPAARKARSII